MALTERLSILIGTVGADGVVRDFDKIGVASKNLGGTAAATGGKFDKLATGLGVSASTLKAGLVTGAAVGAAALGAFGKSAVNAASNLTEVASKSTEVFGESSGLISEWAADAAESFGLSKRAALEAASGFGNMFNQLGVGRAEAAELSQSIVELGADFASFHNADITEVLLAQSSAFRGEYDALQKFLPLINAATVEQRALKLTGKDTTKELTAQDKALAVNALMHEGAGKAAGDFERTSESLANQQRILAANIENASASIGKVLIPAVSSIVDLFNDAIGLAEGLGGGFVDLVDKVNKFTGATDDADNETTGLGDTLNEFYNQVIRGREATDDVAESTGRTVSVISEFGSLVGDIGSHFGLLAGGVDEYTEGLDDLMGTTLAATSAQRSLEQSGRALEAAQRSEADAQKDLNDLLKEGRFDLEAIRDAEVSLASAKRSTGDASRAQAKAQKEYDAALANANDLRGYDTAQDALADAAENLADANDAVADASDREADAARALREAQAGDPDWQNKIADARLRVKDATQGVADAVYDNADAAYEASRAVDTQNTSLETNATAIAAVRGEWEQLIALNPQVAAFLNPALGNLPPAPVAPAALPSLANFGYVPPAGATSSSTTNNVTVNVAAPVADPLLISKEITWALIP